ncbi:MAG: branched-chain amino acid ABC transporter permease [Deferrisomatales bacterium]
MTPPHDPRAAVRGAFTRHRLGWVDAVPWLCVAAAYAFAGNYLSLGIQVMIMAIFALSLDLALGYGGIDTLGQTAFFGAGGYAAGLYALHVSPEPLSGLAVAAAAGAVVALLSGPLILRARGLTLVLLTLAVATLLHELANTLKGITGGDDGLYGYTIAPLFGQFKFDLFRRTAYWYTAGVLAAVYFLCKALVNSPFGLTIRGIRENPVRMRLLGVPVLGRLVRLYAISGALAGIAGGLSAQVTKIVALDVFSFGMSGNVLVMLILGGTGRLYGALLGAAVFVVLADRAAEISPFHWLFALGVTLILAVRYAPSGLAGLIEGAAARLGAGRAAR